MSHLRGITLRLISLAIALCAFAAAGYGQGLTLTASPTALTVLPGQQNVPITVTVASSDSDEPVIVTLTGLPAGISVTPLTLTPGSSGTLYLNVALAVGQDGFIPENLLRETSWTANVKVVGAVGSTQAAANLALTVSISNQAFVPAASAIDLPVVNIDTGGVAVTSKTVDVPGTITIASADGQTSYLPNSSDTDNTATFHVHGNSTAGMPKLAYHIKLNTSLDLLNTMGFNCPYITNGKGKTACDKSKSYILLANYDDKTLLRDWAASQLANAIPIGNGYLNSPANSPSPSGTSTLLPWAAHSLFVELFLNGVYEGNYQLIEEVKVDSHRVNISELGESDTAPADVTGGYLMEIDARKDEAYVFTTPHNFPIGLIDPDFSPDPEVPEQTSYISNYVDTAEAALYSGTFTDPTQGWRAYFDEASAVNYYIVNDLMGNVDGGEFNTSVYLYKDANNPLIYMGPIWDFDVSSGNVNYQPIVSPTQPWMTATNINTWYRRWFQDPGFSADVVAQWNTLKNNGVFSAWLASIQQQSKNLAQSETNNFTRWPILGIKVWPNPQAAGSYENEVAYFLNWLNLRFAYLDGIFNHRQQTSTTLGLGSGTLRNGSPVTLSAMVSGGSSPSGSVSFTVNGILLGTASLSAGSASITTTNLPAGTDTLEAIYSGDSSNALSASAPQSATVLAPLISTATSLAASPGLLNAVTPATFSVSVLGNSGTAIPTGTVALNANGTALGTTSLANDGTANFSLGLPSGSLNVQVVYSGDANYQGSTSNALAFTVEALPPDFALAASPTTANTRYGQTVTASLTLNPQYGFSQNVSFSCSSTAAQASCSFSPSTVTLNSGQATTTASISLSKSDQAALHPLSLWLKLGGGIAAALLLGIPPRRRQIHFLRMILAAAALATAGFMVSACGGGASAISAPVVITATGGGISHTVTIAVTVK